MLKLLFNFGILSFSAFALAKDPFYGHLFSTCDISKDYHMEYFSEFAPKNEEFEVELYKKSSKKGCKGQGLFAVGRIWHYEIDGNELITTLKYVNVVLMDGKGVEYFNLMKFCDHSNWKVYERVSCTGKDIFGEESDVGHRTIHQFKLKGSKLEVKNQDGDITILNKIKAQ